MTTRLTILCLSALFVTMSPDVGATPGPARAPVRVQKAHAKKAGALKRLGTRFRKVATLPNMVLATAAGTSMFVIADAVAQRPELASHALAGFAGIAAGLMIADKSAQYVRAKRDAREAKTR